MNDTIDYKKISDDHNFRVPLESNVHWAMKEAVKQAIPIVLKIVEEKLQTSRLVYAIDFFDGKFITSLGAELNEILKLK